MENYIEKEATINVPLDYSGEKKQTISVFLRDIYSSGNEDSELLFFFNGGPGLSCVRNWRDSEWILEALKTHRVILLDQRGTGRSSPIDIRMLDEFESAGDLLNYLTHFRADNIVRDVEFIRASFFKRDKVSILGQSFGGFIVLSYLSFFPESLNKAFITAGIAPLTCSSVEEVYQYLTQNLVIRNERYYQSYPEDKVRVQAIIRSLRSEPIMIGDEKLTIERFLNLGWYLGSEGGFEKLHYLFDEAFCDKSMEKLSWRFVKNVLQLTSFWEVDPLYAVLHESIYCNGFGSHWAADNVMKNIDFFSKNNDLPYFSGEMVRKKMYDDYVGLVKFSKVAELLAKKDDWKKLYDLEKLRNNIVPISVLLIVDDLYVNDKLSEAALSNINKASVWKHHTWQHDAIRKHGKEVIRNLFDLLV